MALNLKFEDFDTVCYSVQHNLMQLIQKLVDTGTQVDTNTNNINQSQSGAAQMQSDIQAVAREAHDAFLLAQNLNVRVSALEHKVEQLEQNAGG